MFEAELAGLPWVEVESSNISRLAYVDSEETRNEVRDTPEGKTTVEVPVGQVWAVFLQRDDSEAVYVYDEVPQPRFDSVLGAESVGSMFKKLISEGPYPFKRIVIFPDPPPLDPNDDPHLKVLAEIRDELVKSNARLRAMGSAIDNLARLFKGARRTTRGGANGGK